MPREEKVYLAETQKTQRRKEDGKSVIVPTGTPALPGKKRAILTTNDENARKIGFGV